MSGKGKGKGKGSDRSSHYEGIRGGSAVRDIGVTPFYCGYCKGAGRAGLTGRSHFLWTNSLRVEDYQELLDRGWKRGGGRLFELPEVEQTCCPTHTIRLQADAFVASKDQFNVDRRMHRFLEGTYIHNTEPKTNIKSTGSDSNSNKDLQGASEDEDSSVDAENTKPSEAARSIACKIDYAMKVSVETGELPSDICFPNAEVRKVTARMKNLKGFPRNLKYTSNISFQIAAAILKKRTADQKRVGQMETVRSREDDVSATVIAKKIASKLQHEIFDVAEQSAGFCVQAYNGHLNFLTDDEFEADCETNFAEAEERCTLKLRKTGISTSERTMEFDNTRDENSRARRKHKLEIWMRKPEFNQKAFELYRKYQVHVHKDIFENVTEESYKGFAVQTPLHFVPPEEGNDRVPPCGFGTFHQEYLIDGELVAVGVLDIMPKGVSSHYLFYDPDYAFLSLGKYAAIQEILWVKTIQKQYCPSMKYYYLLDYIDSCPKLRYKAEFRPSELLCRLSYRWIPFEVAKPLLDNSKPISSSAHGAEERSRESSSSEEDDKEEEDYNVNYYLIPNEMPVAAAAFQEFARKVGTRLSRRITYLPNRKHLPSSPQGGNMNGSQ